MISQLLLVLAGLAVGLIVTAPVGPVNILSVHAVLERGIMAGVAAGVGAVLADGLLALAAASGVSVIAGIMTRAQVGIQLIGGLILLLFGLRLLLSSPHDDAPAGRHDADGWMIPRAFVLTITNPGAVLGMFALVGSVTSAIGGLNSTQDVMLFVAGVMGGGLLWWLALAAIVARVAHRIDDRRLRLINRAAGMVLLGFGVFLIADVVVRRMAFFAA